MKRFLTVVLITSPILVFSQKNFDKGYLVTKSNDTLRGFIDYKERKKNPTTFDFRPAMDGKTQTFTSNNCNAYGVDEAESFESHVVDITMGETDIDRLSNVPDLSSRTDTVFLRVLQAGKNVTLYSYVDNVKERFYLKSKNGTPTELIRHVYMQEEGVKRVVNGSQYIRQLLDVMRESNPGIAVDQDRLSKLEYNEDALLELVAEINQQKLTKSKHRSSRFFVGLALNRSWASYSGMHDFASPTAKVKVSYLPMLTTGIDIFFNPVIGKLLFRTELSLQMSKNEIALRQGDDNYKHSFDQFLAVITPQVIYNMYNTDHFKVFVGIGGGVNFMLNRNDEYVALNTVSGESDVLKNPLKMEAVNYSFQGIVGVVLNKKIEISAGYNPYMPISNYGVFNVNVERMRLGVNYLFGKK
jgi:hypothetical protein